MYAYSGANGIPGLFSTITASSVDPNGQWATFPLPSSMPQNAYAFVTYNENYDGSYTPNAFNFYSVASSQTIAGNPFGVAAAGITTTTSTIIKEGPRWVGHSTSIYNAYPVVSLYTNGQVLLIRQENSDIAFPPISAKNAEMDGAPCNRSKSSRRCTEPPCVAN
jgi:hypothetical protein